MTWQPEPPFRAVLGGREVEIREMYPGIFNVFDAETGERIAVAVDVAGGWWLGVRIGSKRRELHEPGGVREVARRLLAP
jgi:hypothetical protein